MSAEPSTSPMQPPTDQFSSPTTLLSTPTQSTPSDELFEELGVFADASETTAEPDLIDFQVSQSDSQIAFEISFKASYMAEHFTFLIDMKADPGNHDRLMLNTNGTWHLSRNDPATGVDNFDIDVASGRDALLGFLRVNTWNVRVSLDRIYLEDLVVKQMWVYCVESLDRMPDPGSSPSYYTFAGRVGMAEVFGSFSDLAGDVETFPDFTHLLVSAWETQVSLELTFKRNSSDLTASIHWEGNTGEHEEMILKDGAGYWANSRRYLEEIDSDLDSVSVEFLNQMESGRAEDHGDGDNDDNDGDDDDDDEIDNYVPNETVLIEFPRRRLPDFMNKRIWVYSERSGDRMPDESALKSYFTLGE